MSYYDEPEVRSEFRPIFLPCGGEAHFDHGSGCSYRCINCMTTVGSMGQPKQCKDEATKYETWQKLGGKGWNYEKGTPMG